MEHPRQPQARSIPHRDTFAKNNLLTRGQEVMVEVDPSQRRTSRCALVRCPFTTCACARFAAEPIERPANWFRNPLHPNERCPSRGRGQCHSRAGRGPLRSFCARAGTEPRSRPGVLDLHRHITERNAKIFAAQIARMPPVERTGGTRLNPPIRLLPLTLNSQRQRFEPYVPGIPPDEGPKRSASSIKPNRDLQIH
jgi:hypothetical protein